MSRAAKRLETCPGVRETSASGKIMRSIPDLWKGKKEPLQDVKLEDLADQASAKMAAGNGSIAGLLGHDSTFSFSPLKRSDGKCIISDTFFVTFRNVHHYYAVFPHGVRDSVIWETM